MFVQDALAIFAKRLFLAATLLGLLAGIARGGVACGRRGGEYHCCSCPRSSACWCCASARDLILLFVAFELMSIPLYVLAGFLKSEHDAVEAALKFFLVGTRLLGGDGLRTVVRVRRDGHDRSGAGRADVLGRPAAPAAGAPRRARAASAFKIAAFPFHMWVPDTYEAPSTPFVAWLSVAPEGGGLRRAVPRVLRGHGRARLVAWMPIAAGLAAVTIVAGNLMALPQQNIKRLLAYSGIAHIGYMLRRIRRRLRARHGDGALLSGGLRVREHGRVPGRRGRRALGALGRDGRAARSRPALAAAGARDAAVPALARRHPVRRGLLGEALRVLAAAPPASTGSCSSAPC